MADLPPSSGGVRELLMSEKESTMAKATSHIPEGLTAVIPQLVVKDAHALAEFLTKAFGAKVENVAPSSDGKGVMHGFLRIGGTAVFFCDVTPMIEPTRANLFVYVPDVDASFKSALAAGGKQIMPVSDMFWGDRWGMLADPWGNIWQVATHKETVTPEEMQKRMQAAAKK
jgi:uncharacterized glyoxalase superfamily protein PhnB